MPVEEQAHNLIATVSLMDPAARNSGTCGHLAPGMALRPSALFRSVRRPLPVEPRPFLNKK